MITYNIKKILNISYPLMLAMLVQVLVGMTDVAFLGRVGEVELGASALGGVMYLFVFMLEQSFAVGSQIIMARRNGVKKPYQNRSCVLSDNQLYSSPILAYHRFFLFIFTRHIKLYC